MYLLDTNVVSDLRKARRTGKGSDLAAWAATVPSGDLYICSITLLELEIGVRRLERRDTQQGKTLRDWLDGAVVPAFTGRILSFDHAAAEVCAAFHVPDPAPDRDSYIAAIAVANDLSVVTRDTKDFARFNVELVDPWRS